MSTQNSMGLGQGGERFRAVASLILGAGLLVAGVRGAPPAASAAGPAGTETVVVASRPLVAGTVVGAGDISTVEAVSGPATVAAARAMQDVVGRRLAVTLASGDVLQTAELTSGAAATNSRRLVSLSIDTRSAPPGIRRGDVVEVVRTGDDLHAPAVVGEGRVVDATAQSASTTVVLTLDTDATNALAITGLPAGSNSHVIEVPPT